METSDGIWKLQVDNTKNTNRWVVHFNKKYSKEIKYLDYRPGLTIS